MTDELDMINIKKAIYEGSQRLNDASKMIFKLAKDKAETEKEYRVALAKKLVELREEGVAVGLIGDLARGDKELSDLKYNRDVASETFTAGRDALKAIQSELSALQSILRTQEEI